MLKGPNAIQTELNAATDRRKMDSREGLEIASATALSIVCIHFNDSKKVHTPFGAQTAEPGERARLCFGRSAAKSSHHQRTVRLNLHLRSSQHIQVPQTELPQEMVQGIQYSHVGGNTPPAGNGPDVVFTTPLYATEDASDESRCLNLPTRSALGARERSTTDLPQVQGRQGQQT